MEKKKNKTKQKNKKKQKQKPQKKAATSKLIMLSQKIKKTFSSRHVKYIFKCLLVYCIPQQNQ